MAPGETVTISHKEMFTPGVASGTAFRGFMTAQEIAPQISGLGASTNEIGLLRHAVASPAFPAVVKKVGAMGAAAAFVLAVK